MIEPTYRCGWRIDRRAADYARYSYTAGADLVQIHRGQWHGNMPLHMYEDMTDDQFADFMAREYREAAFDQLQEDLAALAPCAAAYLDRDIEFLATADWEPIRAAIRRYQAAKADMP